MADSRSLPYGDPATSTEDGRIAIRAGEDRGGAWLLVLARGDLSIGLVRRMQLARSIGTNAQVS